jgi:hypothetical protein
MRYKTRKFVDKHQNVNVCSEVIASGVCSQTEESDHVMLVSGKELLSIRGAIGSGRI